MQLSTATLHLRLLPPAGSADVVSAADKHFGFAMVKRAQPNAARIVRSILELGPSCVDVDFHAIKNSSYFYIDFEVGELHLAECAL